MKKLAKVLIIGLFTIGLSGIFSNAMATSILTFDDLEEAGADYESINSYSSDGFTFTTDLPFDGGLTYWRQSHPSYNQSAALFNSMGGSWTKLSADSGSLFTINSIDLDSLNTSGTANVHFYAYDSSDTEVGNLNYDITEDGWATITFDSDFENISYLKFQQSYSFHHFDNVTLNGNVAPVPEPATMLLFGIGLLGLAGVNRRKE
jgi:hypothetical protein